MRLRTIDLLKGACGRYALGAFNVCNMEQIHGLFRGASAAKAPVYGAVHDAIRGTTTRPRSKKTLQAAEMLYPDVVFSVHLDHGDEATCHEAIQSGHYSSVMIDASHEPFDRNLSITRSVVEIAHAAGVAVEAELGQLKGIEDDMEDQRP